MLMAGVSSLRPAKGARVADECTASPLQASMSCWSTSYKDGSRARVGIEPGRHCSSSLLAGDRIPARDRCSAKRIAQRSAPSNTSAPRREAVHGSECCTRSCPCSSYSDLQSCSSDSLCSIAIRLRSRRAICLITSVRAGSGIATHLGRVGSPSIGSSSCFMGPIVRTVEDCQYRLE